MAPPRMTANPAKPARYRPGKAVAEEHSSEDEYETGEEEQAESRPAAAPPPKASSFPTDAAKIANNLRNVDLNERRRQAAAEEAARLKAEKLVREKEEEGFETEESEEAGSSEDSEESGSGSEESSSEDEAPRELLKPKFIKKDKRKGGDGPIVAKTEDQLWADQEAERKATANALIQEQLDRDAEAKAAGKKDWDDDGDVEVEEVDDTDDIDPEMERAAWKLRELKRVKRDREAIEEAEKEREEVERRRNLSKDDREAEDNAFLEQQKEEREGKGKMGYMQKYFHKGAFFQDDAKAEGLDRRDIMGSRYQDDVVNRELLPQYMQIRDMTRLGRKGRTKYKDLKTEDTGRWGQYDDRGPRRDNTLDERFQPDRDGGGSNGPSGANSTAVGQRRKAPQGAPTGPRMNAVEPEEEVKRGDRAQPAARKKERSPDGGRRRSPRRRSHSWSRSSPPRREEYRKARRRSYSRSRSPPSRKESYRDQRRQSYRDQRRRSYSRSRSPPPRRNRDKDDRSRRKRSPSPYYDRYEGSKRHKINAR